ncbi:MAG: RNA methyltransferase [Armatimonadetes bacterium]|nr:RNA methyltransferase [Armatimonadota bacterium]
MNAQPTRITGQKDPIMTLLREITTQEGRRARSLFFVEGDELVLRAYDFGGPVHSLILTERFVTSAGAQQIVERAAALGTPVFTTTSGLLDKILQAKPTPECLAIVERKLAKLSDVFSKEKALVVMLERGENADNLGMLLRSADAVGVSGVILTADTVDPFSRRAVRGSRGAVFAVQICIVKDATHAIEEARTSGLRIVATSARANTLYTTTDFTKPTLVIVGNEHTGISDSVWECSDQVVRIPMMGRVNSLNVAVAASVILYEAVRQRSAL